MPLLRSLVRGLRALLRPNAAGEDVDAEVQHYLDEATAEQMARGASPEQAAHAARREMGPASSIRERVMGDGWEASVSSFARDVRYAARSLRRDAAFTAVVVLTLACGVGASTAIVAAVTPVLFEPLPYPDADRLVSVVETTPAGARNPGAFGMFVHLADRAQSLEALAVLRTWQPVVTGGDAPERLDGQRVSADYFRVLGVSPALGRTFQAAEDRAGGPNVVILGHRLWQRRFAGDASIVGRTIDLDETPYAVAGVLPPGFENVLSPSSEVWAPLQYDLSQGRAWGHHLETIGRLRDGVGAAAATADVDAAGRAVLRDLRPASYDPETRFSVVSLKADLVRGVTPAFAAVLGAVALLLGIACVNVTNLLLARSVGRRGELALRSALGASRWRLARQLVIESLVLAMLGGAAGLLIARFAVDLLVVIAPANLFRRDAVTLAGPIVGFGVALTATIGVGLGLLSVMHAERGELRAALGAGSHRSTGARRRARRALVVVQVGLALVLLIGSGLLLRSLGRLLAIDPGFHPAGVLTMQVQVSGRQFATAEAGSRFFDRVLEAVRPLPGVAAAGVTSQLPLSGELDAYGAHFEAEPSRPAASHPVFRYAVSPGYLESLAIPLRDGRVLDAGDHAGAPRVAVISESLARRRFSSASALGRRLRIGPTDSAPYTIVGVVGSVRQLTLAGDESDAVYVPAVQWPFPDPVRSLVIRTAGDPMALVTPVRQAIRAVDKDQPIVRVAAMTDVVLATAADRRFVLRLFQGFTLAALTLAAAGIYGLLAESVAERRREIGVRLALGGSRRAILSLVVGEGLGLAIVGALAGLSIAASTAGLIGGLLFDVSRFDPATYVAAVAVVISAAVLACVAPAWRAVRIDPATTLRAE